MKKTVKYGIAFVAFAALAYALLKSQEGFKKKDPPPFNKKAGAAKNMADKIKAASKK